MSLNRLQLDVVGVRYLEFRRWCGYGRASRNIESHHYKAERRVRRVRHTVPDLWWKIHEIVFLNGSLLPSVGERPAARENVVNLFFARIGDILALSFGINDDFAEPGNAADDPGFRIACAKNSFVMAARRADVCGFFGRVSNFPMEPGGGDRPFRAENAWHGDQQECERETLHLLRPPMGLGPPEPTGSVR